MTDPFNGVGMRIQGMVHLSPRDAAPLIEAGALLVDIRRPNYINGKRFGVVNLQYLPLAELKKAWMNLPQDRLHILADNVGTSSKDAVSFLQEKGFTKVANLIGGVLEWERDGFSTLVNDDELLVGQCVCKLKPKGDLRKVRKSARRTQTD